MSVLIQSQVVVTAAAALPTPPSSPTSSPQAQDLAARLSGRTIRLPSLKKSLRSWPAATSEYLPEVRQMVDAMLETVIKSPRKLQGLKACDFGFLTSCAFSGSSYEGIQAAALFLVWVFIWDDEIDHGEGENGISTCSDLAREYCQESLDYIRWCLGLCDENEPEPSCDIPNMPLFNQLSQFLVEGMNLAQRQSLFNELNHYIEQCLVEQTGQEIGHIPTPEQYTRMRLGTSGITPGLALCEYTSNVQLPREIMEATEMRLLWKEATSLCMMINDMYSMKKEVKSGALQNMIPVMINASPKSSFDAIMEEFDSIFSLSVASFEEAYRTLDERTQYDSQLNDDLHTYVKSCQRVVTGLLEWSMTTKRYQIQSCLQPDGTALVCL